MNNIPKSVKRPPTILSFGKKNEIYYCPNCGRRVHPMDAKCPTCKQKIDWRDC